MIQTLLRIEDFYKLANRCYDWRKQKLSRTLVPKDVLVQDAVVRCWLTIDKFETARSPSHYFARVILREFQASIRRWRGQKGDFNAQKGMFEASTMRRGRSGAWDDPERGIESVTEDHRFPFPKRPEATGTTSRENMRRLEDVRRDILDLNSKGVHNAEIARVLKISESDVCRFLKANNREAAKYIKPTRISWAEVVAAFDEHGDRKKLARDFGISQNQIGKILRVAGKITSVPRGKKGTVSVRAAEILELNEKGTRNKEIAELLGISQGAVSQMLKKHNKLPAKPAGAS